MKNVYALQFTTSGRATISMKDKYYSKDLKLEYSYNGDDWDMWNLCGLNINSGDTLYIRGNNPDGFSHGTTKYSSFVMNGTSVSCSGNIMSLIDYRKKNLDTIPCDYCFYGLFENCTILTTAPELPAQRLANFCYCKMFSECYILKTAPELPAKTLADYCYAFMFSGCTALKTAPELPAMKLANSCYYRMFEYCTSLKTAPELPATILADNCYSSMFRGCTSLTAKPELPATKLAKNCYTDMFRGCTSLKHKPQLTESYKSRMTFKEYCQRNIL